MRNTPRPLISLTPVPVDPALAEEVARVAAEQRALDDLVREQDARVAALQAKLARGTGDVTDAAAAAIRVATALTPPAVSPMPPLPERIETELRARFLSLKELCHRVRAPAGPVSAFLKRAKAQRLVYNVGSEEQPVYTWVIGDDAPTTELYPLVERLIARRPFEHAELMSATGARRGRVSGAIVDIAKRHGRDAVRNVGGTRARHRWFLDLRASELHGAGSAGTKRAAARRAA